MKTNKTFAILAVAASVAALTSCQKEETAVPSQQEGINTITLIIEQPSDEDATKTVLGTDTSGSYPINWSENDSIAVSSQSGSTYEKYKLTEGKGTPTGTFSGTSVSGAVYAYYPYNGVKSVNSATYTVNIPAQQTYAANSFGEGALPMYGVANNTGELHTLKPLMSVLKLPLKGTCQVSRIVVSSASQKLSGTGTVTFDAGTASMAVTGNDYVELICPNVQLNESTATLFHIAIPASAEGAYTVRIVTNESKVLTKTLTVSTAFTAGKMKKTAELSGVAPAEVMYVEGSYCGTPISITAGSPAVTVVWAPVNCGYDATNYQYGKLYQWGRAVGGGYSGSDAGGVYQEASSSAPSGTTQNTNPSDDVFYIGDPTSCDWYTATGTQLSAWPLNSGDAGYVAGKIANPCPVGWHVPTKDELTVLMNVDRSWITNGGPYSNQTGCLLGTSPNQVFLPAAGYRELYTGTYYDARDKWCFYWSSSVSDKNPYCLYNDSKTKKAISKSGARARGYSVRCVQE